MIDKLAAQVVRGQSTTLDTVASHICLHIMKVHPYFFNISLDIENIYIFFLRIYSSIRIPHETVDECASVRQ